MKGHKKKQMPGGLPHRRNKNIDFVPTLNKKQITLAVLEHEFATELQWRAKIAGQIQGFKT